MPLLAIHRRIHALCTFPPHPPRHHHTLADRSVSLDPAAASAGSSSGSKHTGHVTGSASSPSPLSGGCAMIGWRVTGAGASSSVPRVPPVAARYASRTEAVASDALCALEGAASIAASSDWSSATWHSTGSSRCTPRTRMYTHSRCLQM